MSIHIYLDVCMTQHKGPSQGNNFLGQEMKSLPWAVTLHSKLLKM